MDKPLREPKRKPVVPAKIIPELTGPTMQVWIKWSKGNGKYCRVIECKNRKWSRWLTASALRQVTNDASYPEETEDD